MTTAFRAGSFSGVPTLSQAAELRDARAEEAESAAKRRYLTALGGGLVFMTVWGVWGGWPMLAGGVLALAAAFARLRTWIQFRNSALFFDRLREL
jgi:hypothetical protein